MIDEGPPNNRAATETPGAGGADVQNARSGEGPTRSAGRSDRADRAISQMPAEAPVGQLALASHDASHASCQADKAGPSPRKASEGHEPLSTKHAGSKLRILVVDDESALAELQREMLELNGYDVTLALSGEEGLAKFSCAPGSFSGLIADNRMPGMDGVEMIGKILELNPNLPVILISGDMNVIGNRFFIRPNFKHFQKPVNLKELIEELGKMLTS